MPPFSGYPEDCFNTSTRSILSVGSKSDEEPRKTSTYKKELRFAEYDDVREIPNVHEMSQDEIAGIWMSKKELKTVRTNCIEIVRRMDKKESSPKDDDKLCLRGLKGHSLASRRKRKSVRNALYQTVAEVQSFGASVDVELDSLLAELCGRHSVDSVSTALALAKEDAKSARRAWHPRSSRTCRRHIFPLQ